jgi:tetratricopeptide (TPR) repeat protein
LQSGLQQLIDAGLIIRHGTSAEVSYTFKHALVRDTAYGLLLRSHRRELHTAVAAALESRSPELRERTPELLAHHYTEAGIAEPAINYWAKAARRSVARSANIEAAAQLRLALDLVGNLPEGPARQRQELELQGALGRVLFVSQNWTGGAFPAYTRAKELAEQLGDVEALVSVLGGWFIFSISQAQYRNALETAEKLLEIAKDMPNVAIIAHRCMGVCLHWTGDFSGALEHFDIVLNLYDPIRHRQLAALSGWDLAVHAAYLSCIDLLILGHLDRALTRFELGAKQSRETDDKFSLVFALMWGGIFSLFMQDQKNALRQLKEADSLIAEYHFTAWAGLTHLALGFALVADGDWAEGLALAHAGYEEYDNSHPGPRSSLRPVLNTTFCRALLAGACENAGVTDEARKHLEIAIETAERTGERWFEPELHRLKGEWLLRHTPGAELEAEAAFTRAVDLAIRQNARFWELRASVSLASLHHVRGNVDCAREALAPVYRRFSEGLDWPDLRQAEALLATLSS